MISKCVVGQLHLNKIMSVSDTALFVLLGIQINHGFQVHGSGYIHGHSSALKFNILSRVYFAMLMSQVYSLLKLSCCCRMLCLLLHRL